MFLERKVLILTTAALAGLGLLMVYSSSITPRPSFADQRFLTRQLAFLVVGVTAAAVAARLPVEFWRRAAYPLFFVATALLVGVLIPGVGVRLNGAHRWFRFGSISLQPSELAKLALVLFTARALEARVDVVRRFAGWLPLLVPAAAASALVLVEPDFGTAILLLAVAGLVLFLGGVQSWHLITIAAALVPVFGVLLLARPYRAERMLQFARAWTDPASAPYQVRQSLLAIGSGGWWGTGLGEGWQKLGFLPEANTDFVFAIAGEELGLAGTLTMLALWCSFLVCGMRLAERVRKNRFAYLASAGLVAMITAQAAINIGVVTASLPPKGISLPFISAGGSNLVVSLVSVGLVLGLTRSECEAEQAGERGDEDDAASHAALEAGERRAA